jgi:hypothetical protein
MDPDNYQQAWQAHSSHKRVTINADLLLKEVERNQRKFRAEIFWRDYREIGAAILALMLWFYLGDRWSSPWTWYLTVPVLVWMAGFMLMYRVRHKQKPSKPDEPLLQCLKRSLTDVEDQIWLLRNVFWWYLLPPGISLLAFLVHVTWLKSEDWLDALSDVNIFIILEVIAVWYFLYWATQHTVRSHLEPRCQELLTLLTSLRDETTSEL